ncbi:hypothetical protein BT63DRAFT_456303 [Microthyrium microscopicum]|uniref:Membrane anchor Opy2 N-terminal domain-containing protein n=1 Tax=Microthyrium microscopicum TaxID=703497 RepID=A0A6A6UBG1_9PEZI|nr:hypothetical protein BT63DRAFT_456303 [Microthyrium microscopicum]
MTAFDLTQLFRRCVQCPDTPTSCSACGSNEGCMISPNTCDQCASAICTVVVNTTPTSTASAISLSIIGPTAETSNAISILTTYGSNSISIVGLSTTANPGSKSISLVGLSSSTSLGSSITSTTSVASTTPTMSTTAASSSVSAQSSVSTGSANALAQGNSALVLYGVILATSQTATENATSTPKQLRQVKTQRRKSGWRVRYDEYLKSGGRRLSKSRPRHPRSGMNRRPPLLQKPRAVHTAPISGNVEIDSAAKDQSPIRARHPAKDLNRKQEDTDQDSVHTNVFVARDQNLQPRARTVSY